MRRGWVVAALLVLAACTTFTAQSFITSIIQQHENKTVTVDRVEGEQLQLLKRGFQDFCPEFQSDRVVRIQITGDNSTMTKIFTPRGRELCEFDTTDPDYARKSTAVVVNNRSIKLAEIQSALQAVPPAQRAQSTRPVIENLVRRELLLHEADKRGVTVSATAVNRGVQNSFNSSQLQQLDEAGLEQLQERVRQQLRIRQVQQDILNGTSVTVRENEARQFYQDNDSLSQPERYRFRQIQLNKRNQTAQSRQKAQTVFGLLNQSGFCSLVKQFSDDTQSLDRCGEYTFTEEQMSPSIGEQVTGMQPEETRIVESPQAFHIIKFKERLPAGKPPFEDVKDQIEQLLRQEKQQQELQRYVGQLRNQSEIISYLG